MLSSMMVVRGKELLHKKYLRSARCFAIVPSYVVKGCLGVRPDGAVSGQR